MRKLYALWIVVPLLFGCDIPVAQDDASDKPTAKADAPKPVSRTPEPKVQSEFASVDEALAAMAAAIDSGNTKQKNAAYIWLSKSNAAAVSKVAAALGDSSGSVEYRRLACGVLARLGPSGTDAVIAATQSDEPRLKLKAIESLATVDPPTTPIVDCLIALVDDDDEKARRAAIRALGNIGPPAKRAGDRLLALRNSTAENETIRGEADRALKLVSPRATFQD